MEFVAAGAGDEAALAGQFQPAGNFAQQRIAHRMAEHIVDRLEAVEIDAEHGKAFSRSFGEFERGGDAFVERGAVRQVGERIVVRHVRDALLVALAVGQVMDDADQILRISGRTHQRKPGRGYDAQTITGREHRMLVEKRNLPRFDQPLVFRVDDFGARCRHDLARLLSKHALAADAEVFFRRAVDKAIAQVRDVLHDDR